MALSGMHIVCAGATAAQSNGPLPINAIWSQTMASAGATTQAVPPSQGGAALIRCRGTADSFVATGKDATTAIANAANASAGPRWFVPANEDRDIYANSGEFVAWVAA